MAHRSGNLLIALMIVGSSAGTAAPWRDESAARIPQDIEAGSTMDVAMADLDGDGDLDLVLAKEFRPNQFLRNDGQNRFAVIGSAFGNLNEDSEDIAIGDFDRDGDPDVVFVSEDTSINQYWKNNGQGQFSPSASELPRNTISNAVQAGDIDRDDDLDLIISRNTARELVLLNNGAGVFSDASTTWMPDVIDTTQDLKLVDLDADGDLDLVAGNESIAGGRNRLYVNLGTRFADETAARIPIDGPGESTRKVSIADVDRDGDPDLFFANTGNSPSATTRNRLLINNGGAVFTDQSNQRLPVFLRTTMDAEFFDVESDGDADVVLGDFQHPLQLWRNDGQGRFTDDTLAEFGGLAVSRSSIGLFRFAQGGQHFLFDAGYQDLDRMLVRSTAPRLDSRFTGAFYNPAQNGHGFQFYVLEDQIAVTWFTFDTDGSTRWVVAQGPIPEAGNDTATLATFRGKGMVFGTFDPAQYQLESWGTLFWRTIDCDRAEVRYESSINGANGQPLGSGTIALQRLVRIPGLDCRTP